MPAAAVPTAAGQVTFAKGRLRPHCRSFETGARLPADDHHPATDDPEGFTATLKNEGETRRTARGVT